MFEGMKTVLLAGVLAVTGCAHVTSHPEAPATLGRAPTASLDALVDQDGSLTVETVVGAEWVVPLSGLLNLDHPAAKAAHLKDHDEPIVVVFHAVHHPTRGTYLIDTGVEHALFDDPDHAAVRGLVASVAHTDRMMRVNDTRFWLSRQPAPPSGVFLTHLHFDHIAGMADVPAGTPVFAGPGEASERTFQNVFVEGSTDRALAGKPPIATWQFAKDPDGGFEGILDVFGDGSFFALHVPGHTPGSTAYVARTTTGPVLFTGDACHTTWGWTHGVEPGSFSSDRPRSAESLERLRRFAAKHPRMGVRVGHQLFEDPVVAAGTESR